ncbi:Uu.00g025730.m01.CDS01 [Anthostomella pinea]|uniref:non-specific serine/threonine protein kinase n=1 Tax=Anthostomella pinea TaxID=933095 RepID=A0AAI8V8E5_9PEZI|nr:Uu.00g025730.m01.CDS01 [Anthostomella pinea]
MELIPYTSREGREIVLRHRNALVVRDPTSQRLEIRGIDLTKCPTCHQPLRARSASPERHFDIPTQNESYVDPNYFRMLQAGLDTDDEHNAQRQAPSSPVRRLTRPLPSGDPRPQDADEAEFVSSIPAPREGARIRRAAFNQDYFKTFFVEEGELGRGGKGVVLLVRHVLDRCALGHFACKRVPVGDDHAWLEKVLIEVELLAKLTHPNLVSYRHVWLEDVKLHRFGPSVACAFILQQYCNSGDLLRYIVGEQPKETTKEQLKARMRRRSKDTADHAQDAPAVPTLRRLPFEEIYALFRDITSGLAYLHAANYIHRDLKPSNCLLHLENGKLTCLISDFGEVQPGDAVRKSTGTTGTISYCAPEVLKMDALGRFGDFTTKSDVFSLGMILYFLCFGRLPYSSANIAQEELEDVDQLRAEITHWEGFQDERRERPDLPPQLYQLLKKMLALEPAQRPSATEVLSVMNHESHHGGLRTVPRSTSPPIGLQGRRIQSLDSPMPPSTPQPEPVKQRYGSMEPEDHATFDGGFSSDHVNQSPQASLENSLQKYLKSSKPRHRPQAMTLSRSQDNIVHSPPDRALATGIAHSPSPSNIQTPLLMPPPVEPLGAWGQRAMLSQYFLSNHSESIIFTVRFGLFLVKIASLAQVCWPFIVNAGVGVPLVGVAGLDLAMPSSSYQGGSRRQISKDSSQTWRWGWRVSTFLLMLHFIALGAISRWGALCATRDERLDW